MENVKSRVVLLVCWLVQSEIWRTTQIRQPEMILHWNHECVSDVLEVGCFCTFFISRTANITVDLHVDFSYLMLSFWVSRVQGIELFSIWYCYSILCKEHTLNILI